MTTMKDGSDQPGDFERADAALWDLMGKVPPPTVSPYFSRRVQRELVRLEEERGPAVRWLQNFAAGWRLPHPAWSVALATALVGAVGLSVASHETSGRLRHASLHAAVVQRDGRDDLSARDVEVIADLDNLMAYEENRIWTEESNTD